MGWVVNATLRRLYPLDGEPVPFVRESWWATGPVWMVQKISPLPGFNPWTVQSVASYCTD